MRFALQNAKTILDYFQELIKYEYPLKKLDLVVLPNTKVELQNRIGLISLKEADVVQLSNGYFSVIKTQKIVQTIANKLAKIW